MLQEAVIVSAELLKRRESTDTSCSLRVEEETCTETCTCTAALVPNEGSIVFLLK